MPASKNIIDAVIDDHKEIQAYYEQYLANAGNAHEQQKWANQLAWEVARHSAAEELVLYPLLEKNLPDGKALADKDRAQHLEAKKDLAQLDKLKAGTQEFDSLIAKTIRDLREHIKEEEQIDLPKIAATLSAEESLKVGNEFQRTKHFVPTRAHPGARDKPPFETVAGLLAAPLDKLRDLLKTFPSEEEKKAAVI
ncbi:hypothetical protein HDV00_005426 [Rhizophlyctis rosea]|nr:hypothetical protein HDV00_005426 [Rhizophlyctis rosea]